MGSSTAFRLPINVDHSNLATGDLAIKYQQVVGGYGPDLSLPKNGNFNKLVIVISRGSRVGWIENVHQSRATSSLSQNPYELSPQLPALLQAP